MREAIKFILIGYLSGSILFARICAKLLNKPGILYESKDGNPGTVPIFFHFHGGKGIAVTFGCLLGVYPELTPVLIFALLFVFFSAIFRITPHFARTIVTYVTTLLIIICLRCSSGLVMGFGLISATVILRLHISKEVREKPEVRLLWMH